MISVPILEEVVVMRSLENRFACSFFVFKAAICPDLAGNARLRIVTET